MSSLRRTLEHKNHDFEFASRGLVAPLEDPLIFGVNSKEVVWNAQAYEFLNNDCPPTANKSLWRQGQLCSVTPGLYLVTEGVYQVRGLDLANMSIVQIPNTNQIIIIDCLTCPETARKAIELYGGHHEQKFGQKPEIHALFYTHCHIDHFGGAKAIQDFVTDQHLRIIGPDGFLHHAVSENVYAGAAMARRSIYMYGQSLDKSPTGQIGCGLGQAVALGKNSLVAPNQIIKEDGVLKPGIDGLEIICQLTPGTEAPAEVNFFFPQYSALCMAENATHTLHNIQTLRGAPVRDARLWSRYLDESISLFGDKTEVVFSTHHWPTWKEEDDNLAVAFLSEQRDFYAYLHNETLRLLNNGSTSVEIAEEIEIPPELSLRTNIRGYYGSVSHNVKAIYDKYLGWFDGNPANLWPLPPVEEATQYIQCMGGSENVLKLAQQYRDDRNLRFAATLLNKLIFAKSLHQDAAKKQLADIYQELGYGAENATWRNIYLVGARELRYGPQAASGILDLQSLMSLNLDQLFDVIAIRVEGPRAFKHGNVTIDFMVEDIPHNLGTANLGWHLRLSNGAVTGHDVPYVSPPEPRDRKVGLTVWVDHKSLVAIVASAAAGKPFKIDKFTTAGNIEDWYAIASFVQIPNPAFNIVGP
jgi:alkyl sulfatase BDS1-like metallo-beta-lactamase superfamily hydrolase